MYVVFRHTRANLPIRYAFSVVRLAPERTPNAFGPYVDWMRSISDGDARDRRVVGDRREAASARADRAVARCSEPVGMAALQVALHALRAEHPLVEREVVPRLEADDQVVFDLELDAALLAAEAAVRRDDLVGLDAGIDARTFHPVEVRSPRVGEDVLFFR